MNVYSFTEVCSTVLNCDTSDAFILFISLISFYIFGWQFALIIDKFIAGTETQTKVFVSEIYNQVYFRYEDFIKPRFFFSDLRTSEISGLFQS